MQKKLVFEDGYIVKVHPNGTYDVLVGAREFPYTFIRPTAFSSSIPFQHGDQARIGFLHGNPTLAFIFGKPGATNSPIKKGVVVNPPNNNYRGLWVMAEGWYDCTYLSQRDGLGIRNSSKDVYSNGIVFTDTRGMVLFNEKNDITKPRLAYAWVDRTDEHNKIYLTLINPHPEIEENGGELIWQHHLLDYTGNATTGAPAGNEWSGLVYTKNGNLVVLSPDEFRETEPQRNRFWVVKYDSEIIVTALAGKCLSCVSVNKTSLLIPTHQESWQHLINNYNGRGNGRWGNLGLESHMTETNTHTWTGDQFDNRIQSRSFDFYSQYTGGLIAQYNASDLSCFPYVNNFVAQQTTEKHWARFPIDEQNNYILFTSSGSGTTKDTEKGRALDIGFSEGDSASNPHSEVTQKYTRHYAVGFTLTAISDAGLVTGSFSKTFDSESIAPVIDDVSQSYYYDNNDPYLPPILPASIVDSVETPMTEEGLISAQPLLSFSYVYPNYRWFQYCPRIMPLDKHNDKFGVDILANLHPTSWSDTHTAGNIVGWDDENFLAVAIDETWVIGANGWIAKDKQTGDPSFRHLQVFPNYDVLQLMRTYLVRARRASQGLEIVDFIDISQSWGELLGDTVNTNIKPCLEQVWRLINTQHISLASGYGYSDGSIDVVVPEQPVLLWVLRDMRTESFMESRPILEVRDARNMNTIFKTVRLDRGDGTLDQSGLAFKWDLDYRNTPPQMKTGFEVITFNEGTDTEFSIVTKTWCEVMVFCKDRRSPFNNITRKFHVSINYLAGQTAETAVTEDVIEVESGVTGGDWGVQGTNEWRNMGHGFNSRYWLSGGTVRKDF